MSRFALVRKGRPASLANLLAPVAGGTLREGYEISIDAGEWNFTPNAYRFRVYYDGVLDHTDTQLDSGALGFGEHHYTCVAGNNLKEVSITLEASTDAGASWVAAPVDHIFTPDTLVQEPAIPAADLTVTRTSSAGAALRLTIGGTILRSQQLDIVVLEGSDYSTKVYQGSLSDPSPVTNQLATDAFALADPPLPSLSGRILKFRGVTQDFVPGDPNPADGAGAYGPWVAVSDTDFGGPRYITIAVSTAEGGSTFSGAGAAEVKLSVGSGPNLLSGKNYYQTAGHETPPIPEIDTYALTHLWDGDVATHGNILGNGAALPGKFTVDLLLNYPVDKLTIQKGTVAFTPSTFQAGPSNSAGTITTLWANETGLTWTNGQSRSWP